MRVLLIEDDGATAHSIELMLKSESFNVYATDLGEEGVDLGKLYDYDIILLDLNLPDMSGFEVLRSLRVAKVETPILILSGITGIEDKVKALGFGADDYLTKPFHKNELIARIHAIVRRSQGHAQSVVQIGDLIVNVDAKTVHIKQVRVNLTSKEYRMHLAAARLRSRHGDGSSRTGHQWPRGPGHLRARREPEPWLAGARGVAG
jgi:two-component system, cell cycle response regulator CtrA